MPSCHVVFALARGRRPLRLYRRPDLVLAGQEVFGHFRPRSQVHRPSDEDELRRGRGVQSNQVQLRALCMFLHLAYYKGPWNHFYINPPVQCSLIKTNKYVPPTVHSAVSSVYSLLLVIAIHGFDDYQFSFSSPWPFMYFK
jgi:hypothetical protein